MPSCSICGATDYVGLYERRDAPGVPRAWWCIDCRYFAGRLEGAVLEPAARWVERAALNELPLRSVDDPMERRTSFGRRATDRLPA